jgi:hypothetical protein
MYMVASETLCSFFHNSALIDFLDEACRSPSAWPVVASCSPSHSDKSSASRIRGYVSGPRAPHPVVVYKHEYVDIHIPPKRFPEVNAAAHASLDAKFEQHKAILGDTEKVMYAAMDAETEALDEIVWTVPTSIAGVLALLDFRSEASDMDDDQTSALLCSVADALRDIHQLLEAGATVSIPVVQA